MKKSMLSFIVLSFIFIMNIDAQERYTRIGLMTVPTPSQTMDLPVNMTLDHGWFVPPVFIEKDRRILKIFTIGTELMYGNYKITASGPDFHQRTNMHQLGLELQGKLSIPVMQFLELYAQYGLGYMHTFTTSALETPSQNINSNVNIGFTTNTMSLGGSVFLTKKTGLFAEIGAISSKSVQTIAEIYDGYSGDYGPHVPTSNEVGIPNDHITGVTAFIKLGLVFRFIEE